tara:strand:+ start:397 stop:897 length:501 start_codon:yes stop_codon:yes gene_type:complete
MMNDDTGSFLYGLMEGEHDDVLAKFNRRGDEIEYITLHGYTEDTGTEYEEGQSMLVTLDFFESHPDDNAKDRVTLGAVWVRWKHSLDDRPISMDLDGHITFANTWHAEDVPEEEQLSVEPAEDDQLTRHPASFRVRDGEYTHMPRPGPEYMPGLAQNQNTCDELPF